MFTSSKYYIYIHRAYIFTIAITKEDFMKKDGFRLLIFGEHLQDL